MRRPGSGASLLFRLVIPAVVVFIATILAMIAAVMGDQTAPFWGWLDQNAGRLLFVEFVVIIALTLLSLTVDRLQSLRSQRSVPSESAQSPPVSSRNSHSSPEHDPS